MQDPPHGPPNKPSSATSFENFSFHTIGKPPTLLARFSTEIVSPAQSSGLSPSPTPRTESNVLPQTSNPSVTSPLTLSRNALHGGTAPPSIPVRSAASVSSMKPEVGDPQPPITASSFQRPAIIENRPQADVDGSHSATVQAQSSAHQPQLSPLSLATVDFYKRISDLAKERAEWEELSTLHQRYREEHEEYTRRHEETIRAAQREKDQVDRVVAAADMALGIIDKLRTKQEQRLIQEQRLTDDALAASLVKPPTRVEVSSAPVKVNVITPQQDLHTLSKDSSAPNSLAYSAPASAPAESPLAEQSSTASGSRRSEQPSSPTVSSDATSHLLSYNTNPKPSVFLPES
ncbi:hypothetical protein NLI96_g2207 [Meripilus lineatus]|uniref:Uncharacterized protein n=1 Tax=Meripilus lineatus TaxID=2056292 RepID=A0AAD5V8Y5_9APHY|nr:hypothetical protein NLI96_g2207 [Physisporinus lineatus]